MSNFILVLDGTEYPYWTSGRLINLPPEVIEDLPSILARELGISVHAAEDATDGTPKVFYMMEDHGRCPDWLTAPGMRLKFSSDLVTAVGQLKPLYLAAVMIPGIAVVGRMPSDFVNAFLNPSAVGAAPEISSAPITDLLGTQLPTGPVSGPLDEKANGVPLMSVFQS